MGPASREEGPTAPGDASRAHDAVLSRCVRMPRRSLWTSSMSCSRDIPARSSSMCPPSRSFDAFVVGDLAAPAVRFERECHEFRDEVSTSPPECSTCSTARCGTCWPDRRGASAPGIRARAGRRERTAPRSRGAGMAGNRSRRAPMPLRSARGSRFRRHAAPPGWSLACSK